MITLTALFFIGMLAPVVALFLRPRAVSPIALINCALLSACVCYVTYELGKYSPYVETEILNGYVVSKKQERQDCLYPGWFDHSDPFCLNEETRQSISHYAYLCENEDIECGKEPVFKTEYSYKYPWEKKHFIASSLKSWTIARTDERGEETPPRWSMTEIGDPVSIKSAYTKYVRRTGYTALNPKYSFLFGRSLDSIPDYPDNVYDYYRIDRLVLHGVVLQSPENWNKIIGEINSEIGTTTRSNLIVVLTSGPPSTRFMFERKWRGGNRNDIIVFIGLQERTIVWTDVTTFLHNKGNESLRENILNMNKGRTLDVEILKSVKNTIIQYHSRAALNNADLLKRFEPPLFLLLFALFVNFIIGRRCIYYFSTTNH